MKIIHALAGGLALAAALLCGPAARATTYTTQYSIAQSGYTDIGAGPLQVGLNGFGGVYLIVADAQPSSSAQGEQLDRADSTPTSRPYLTASHVWARAITAAGAQIQVTAGLSGAQPVGAAAFASPAPVTVGTSATLILAARLGAAGTGRIHLTITCSAAVAIGPTNGVTFAGAGQIPANAALTLDTTSAVYGIVGSGSATCSAWETF
jgi:hypothetical protein